MKAIQFIVIALIIQSSTILASDEFKWTEKDGTQVRFGLRIQELKAWSKKLLVIQTAVKNESLEVRYIPVAYADMNIRLPSAEYWLTIVREGDDPFSPTRVPITPGGATRDLRQVIEPQRYIRIDPGEVFEFSPVTTDIGDGPAVSKMTVATRLKVCEPLAGYPAIEITKAAAERFADDTSKKIDPQKVPIGEWGIQVPYEMKK